MATALTPQIAKALRDLVASAIAGEKSYNVPAVCRRFGLADGTDEEAHRSKFTYVSNRTKELSPPYSRYGRDSLAGVAYRIDYV
jgi:hypothetical protein